MQSINTSQTGVSTVVDGPVCSSRPRFSVSSLASSQQPAPLNEHETTPSELRSSVSTCVSADRVPIQKAASLDKDKSQKCFIKAPFCLCISLTIAVAFGGVAALVIRSRSLQPKNPDEREKTAPQNKGLVLDNQRGQGKPTFCQNEAAVQAGKHIMQRVNLKKNACKDFWHYACSKNIKLEYEADGLSKMSKQARKYNHQAVSNAVFSYNYNLTAIEERKIHQILKKFISRCDDYYSKLSSDRVHSSVTGLMKHVNWALLMKQLFAHTKREILHKIIKQFMVNTPINPLLVNRNLFGPVGMFGISIRSYPQWDKSREKMKKKTLIFLRPDFEENQSIEQNRKYGRMLKLLSSVLLRFLGTAGGVDFKPALFMASVGKVTHKLAKLTKTFSLRKARKGIQQLALRTYTVNWKRLLFEMFKKSVDKELVVVDLNYFVKLDMLLRQTNNNDIFYYLLAKWFYSWVPVLITRQSQCTKLTSGLLPMSSGYVLQTKTNMLAEIQAGIKDIEKTIKQGVVQSILRLQWASGDTKEALIDSTLAIDIYAGFPSRLFEFATLEINAIWNTSFLARRTSFIDCILILAKSKNQIINKIISHKLTFQVPPLVFANSPVNPNAFYSSIEHTIVISPSYIRPPIYIVNGPLYLNYGGYGFILAHEILHGLSHRTLHVAFSNSSLDLLRNVGECLVNHYTGMLAANDYTTAYASSGLEVDGEKTLNENMADIGGLNVAYLAYKMAEKNLANSECYINETKKISPDMNLYTDRMFLISFAQLFCRTMNLETAIYMVGHDVHAPDNVRVQGSLENFKFKEKVLQCETERLGSCKYW